MTAPRSIEIGNSGVEPRARMPLSGRIAQTLWAINPLNARKKLLLG
jgi:hypothetical protein